MKASGAIGNGNRGIAMLMVMSSVALLATLLAAFTYDTELNKIRTSNIQEKLQARLNAESGLHFAVAKLRLYQEARNKISKNKSLQTIITPALLESPILQPFVYPVPADREKLNLAQKSALEDFEENSLISGKINVEIQKVQGFINPNHLRIDLAAIQKKKTRRADKEKKRGRNDREGDLDRKKKKEKDKEREEDIYEEDEKEEGEQRWPWEIIREELTELIDKTFDDEKKKNSVFWEEYSRLSPEFLVDELAFFVNRPNNFQSSSKSRLEAFYQEKGATPKHAPLSSIDEMYLLVGWPDALTDMLKDKLTVHENGIIDINEMTHSQLDLLFSSALEETQLEDFFKYRDGSEEEKIFPHPFRDEGEFKNFLTGELELDPDFYEQRIGYFEQANIKLGVAGNLYKVISTGEFNRTSYKITAFVELPVAPSSRNPKTKIPRKKRGKERFREKEEKREKRRKESEKKKTPQVLLPPRIVEIRLD